MTVQNVFYFDNSFTMGTSQHDIGPLHVGPCNRILHGEVHGTSSKVSENLTVPFTLNNDLLYGLQWVAHGAAPQAVLTSPPGDQWLWRIAMAQNNDLQIGWGPQSTNTTVQTAFSLHQVWRGQGIKPAADIDVYLSFQAMFGVSTQAFGFLGAFNITYE